MLHMSGPGNICTAKRSHIILSAQMIQSSPSLHFTAGTNDLSNGLIWPKDG
ncbi:MULTISPECIES: hypothetical protein [unclassified Mesorhizobium]|uniref:hypothetical protein n=1 Tax=unclassified Mesorhizobium TaxID=325217 RepID=UPI001CCF3E9A|nr:MULTISPECIES: hypothetical protein [unclassified Mesorhizobium]MBZ9838890.1 hypothetical protein [Mesorhizobium sp. CA3]